MLGHGLQAEGSAYTADGARVMYNTVAGTGHGRCACGETSPEAKSGNARKAWHRQHKAEILAKRRNAATSS